MKIKTQDLIDKPLDWAVARALGYDEWDGECFTRYADGYYGAFFIYDFRPSTDWAQGGPIIEQEIIGLDYDDAIGWEARDFDTQQVIAVGPTPLIAAMRCYVASKLGDEVEVPEELK